LSTDELGWLMVALVVFEGLQVFIMNLTLRNIKAKLELVVPDGKPAAAILSDTIFEFMRAINDNKNGEAQAVGGFIRGAAVAAFEEIKPKIPLLGGGAAIDDNLERIAKKNPWAGLILTGIQMAAPAIQQMQQQQQKGGVNNAPRPGKGGVGYG